MKKILIFSMLFIVFSLSSYARRTRFVENNPWELSYTINEFGEKDKVVGASCGKYALQQEIYIDKDGIYVKINERTFDLPEKISSITFLFDSKDRVVVDSGVIEEESEVYMGKKYFISKTNKNYKKLINKIKNSYQMSILIEDVGNNSYSISEISNYGSTAILNKIL